MLNDEFLSVNPSHPLGGPDGIKDILCSKDGKKWVAGAYFPRGQKSFSDIKDKFISDSRGKDANGVDAFVFVTNQELKLSEREELISEVDFPTDIYHLERISLMLNSPPLYGVRLEFLDIEMTKEEQLAFMAARDKVIVDMQAGIARIEAHVDKKPKSHVVTPQYDPVIGRLFVGKKLIKCKHCGYGFYLSTMHQLLGMSALYGKGTITCPECGHVEEEKSYN